MNDDCGTVFSAGDILAIYNDSLGELLHPKGRSFLRIPANARYLGGFKGYCIIY